MAMPGTLPYTKVMFISKTNCSEMPKAKDAFIIIYNENQIQDGNAWYVATFEQPQLVSSATMPGTLLLPEGYLLGAYLQH